MIGAPQRIKSLEKAHRLILSNYTAPQKQEIYYTKQKFKFCLFGGSYVPKDFFVIMLLR